jgi:hypothetical protein
MSPKTTPRAFRTAPLGVAFLALVLLRAALLVFERTDAARALVASRPDLGRALRIFGLAHSLAILGVLGAMVYFERRARPGGQDG